MSILGKLHNSLVFERRIRVLSRQLAGLLPSEGRLLDVGCGDGHIDQLIGQLRPRLQIEGIDVLVRDRTHIPVSLFDGTTMPFASNSFDAVMFVDVLHHTEDPKILLKEAHRVARHSVILKDHLNDEWFAETTLRFMDWIGNAPHGVVLPYNYWNTRQWRDAFSDPDYNVAEWKTKLGLYPVPASWMFDRSMHFVARLEVVSANCRF